MCTSARTDGREVPGVSGHRNFLDKYINISVIILLEKSQAVCYYAYIWRPGRTNTHIISSKSAKHLNNEADIFIITHITYITQRLEYMKRRMLIVNCNSRDLLVSLHIR